MIIGQIPQADRFRQQLRESFHKQPFDCRVVRVAKNGIVYTSGQQDESIYFIHTGRIKLLLPSPVNKECLLAIRTAGDLFGELCLAGRMRRLETAVAMEDTCLKRTSYRSFLTRLRNESLLEGLIQYLAVRLAEQQEVIVALATANSEQRLARTLIHLARILGMRDSRGTRIAQRISQEELAEMVGTTRTRIGIFLKRFRELGLIGLSEERCLVVDSGKLRAYLDGPCIDEKGVECPFRQVETGAGDSCDAPAARCLLETNPDSASLSIPRDYSYP